MAGLVRVSIWCIAGLLFFMAVFLLRAGGAGGGEEGARGATATYKVRSLRSVLSGGLGGGQQQQRRRRRRNTWHANAAAAVASIAEDEEEDDDEEEEEEEEEDMEEAVGKGLDAAALSKSLHRSAQLLTPIPEYAPSDGGAAAGGGVAGLEEEEEEEVLYESVRPEGSAAGAVRT
jgi:hypothetical protein